MGRSTLDRSTTRVVRTQTSNIAADVGPYITSAALSDNLQFTLPAAADNAGLWFEITHTGPRVTTVIDEAESLRFDFNTPGQAVVFEVVGDREGELAWAVTSAVLPPECRVWDADTSSFRQATSMQDVVDSLHTQIRDLIEVVRLQGAQLTADQEAFHECTQAG